MDKIRSRSWIAVFRAAADEEVGAGEAVGDGHVAAAGAGAE